jgi:two-component sensor histidine kinase
MALLHEALYRSENLARVDFGPYVQHLCAHLARAYGQNAVPVALRVRIEDLQLDLERAVPCGLIVSEAVTNAFKHAFARRAEGEIEVAARAVDGQWVELRVIDNGIGLPPAFDPSHAATLGFQLLSRLAQQLEGPHAGGGRSGHAGAGDLSAGHARPVVGGGAGAKPNEPRNLVK